MINAELRMILISVFVILGTYDTLAQDERRSAPGGITDPPITLEYIRDLPFMKPELTLQKALKISEASLKKKIDLKLYFLYESKLSTSVEHGILACWYFKWVRWGVKQSEYVPLEVIVSMEGKVTFLSGITKNGAP
jgi:hypothetical protein